MFRPSAYIEEGRLRQTTTEYLNCTTSLEPRLTPESEPGFEAVAGLACSMRGWVVCGFVLSGLPPCTSKSALAGA